jgi:hypothetical protein
MAKKSITLSRLGGVDSRSNPMVMSGDRCLRSVNWRLCPDGHMEGREGYKPVTMSAVTAGAIHSIRYFRTVSGGSYIVFWQGTTPKLLNLANGTVTAPTVKGKAVQSSARFTYYLSNNRLHAVNGTDYKWLSPDDLQWRDIGIRELTAAEIAAITLTSSAVSPGSELTDATGWTATNWAGDYNAGFTHAAGTTSALSRAITGMAQGKTYRVAFTVALSAGTLTVMIGNADVKTVSASGSSTVNVTAFGAGDLSFTPSAEFAGTVSAISVSEIAGTGISASTVGGAQPGYQFYACLYNPVSGHVGNRVKIGARLLWTDTQRFVQIAGLPALSAADDAELCVLVGRTGDGGEVPYTVIDGNANWISVPHGTTSATISQGKIDGNCELPVDNYRPPASLFAVAQVGERTYGITRNAPWLYYCRTLSDMTTGDYVGRPEQSWNQVCETFPTCEHASSVAEYTGDALVASLNDSALLSDPMGTGKGWNGPWNTGWAGPFAGCRGWQGLPYWISGEKQLCTMGSSGPVPISEEYEAALLASIADAHLSEVEVVYERIPAKRIDRLRIHFIDGDGAHRHVFHDFGLRDTNSPYGQGYEYSYNGILAQAHTIAQVRDSAGQLRTYAGASDGRLYVLDEGANDNGTEFDADRLMFQVYGDDRPLVGPFEYHGDDNLEWSICDEVSSADLATKGNFETMQPQEFPGEEKDHHWLLHINRPELLHAYVRIQWTSHSADAPNGMDVNDPPHCPLEVYGRVWMTSVDVGDQRGR